MRSLALYVSGVWCLALLAFPLSAAGWLPFELALLLVLLSGCVGAVLALRGRVASRTDPNQKGPTLAAAALATLVLCGAVWGLVRYPWTNDVATSVETPPRFAHLDPKDASSSEPVYGSEHQRKHAQPRNLSSATSSAQPNVMLGRAMIAARTLPHWKLTVFDMKTSHLEGTTRSRFLGIPSQIAVSVRREGRQSVLDVRSRSPIFLGDFGGNARVLRQFLKALGEAAICRPSAEFMQPLPKKK